MSAKLKSLLWVLVFTAAVGQLAGCIYDRQGRRYGQEHQRQDDRGAGHGDHDERGH